jgi:hypothetical protein
MLVPVTLDKNVFYFSRDRTSRTAPDHDAALRCCRAARERCPRGARPGSPGVRRTLPPVRDHH